MSTLSIRLRLEELRSLAAGSIGAAYMGVGTALSHPARQFIIVNLTDATVMFSFDGVTDHVVFPRNGIWINDVTANKTEDQGFYLAQGDRLYVKQVGAPTTGAVYFSVLYGSV